jgi:hypothetical protein
MKKYRPLPAPFSDAFFARRARSRIGWRIESLAKRVFIEAYFFTAKWKIIGAHYLKRFMALFNPFGESL